jgi:hypothetical protein
MLDHFHKDSLEPHVAATNLAAPDKHRRDDGEKSELSARVPLFADF